MRRYRSFCRPASHPAGSGRIPNRQNSDNSRAVFALVLAACLVCGQADLPAVAAANPSENKPKQQDAVLKGLPVTELSVDEAVLHALKQMGLAKWIDLQLNPKSIDDSAVEARLNIYPTLKMSNFQLMAEYPNPKQQAAKPNTQAKEETPEQKAQKQADAAITVMARDLDGPEGTMPANNATVAAASPDTPSPMKLNPPTRGAGRNALSVDPNAVPPAISDDSKRPQRVVEELAMAKMTRAVYSERQLQQVMDDFWFNHFNVFAGKGEVKWYLTSYERDVIQPHALGKFKDLVTVTAKSPAMLFYLDNFLSADPKAAERLAEQRALRQMQRGPGGRRPPVLQPANPQNAKKQERGLNENYGRELMELHTLGVDGGYTQKD